MPGNWINAKQVDIYMTSRKSNNTQVLSSVKAGISERSGRAIEQGKRQDPRHKVRHWRTRKDPLQEAWQAELTPMLKQSPSLQAITLLEYLQGQHPGQYPDKLLRTLQRRIKQWRALEGSDKDVIFRQTHEPARQGLSDFTLLKGVTITIAGSELKHLLYHFRLAFSHWSYMKVVLGGESYTALAEGLSEALTRLGGSPLEHRTDSLSAAFKNLSRDDKKDMTQRYDALCQHYNMTATRNNLGVSHENGSVESSHGHLKRRIEQALLLRDSHDFASVKAYQAFIEGVVKQHNQRNAKEVDIERLSLQALPQHHCVDYTEVVARVSTSSTIEVRRITYSVPSRLISETLRIRLYHDRLSCYLGGTHVITLDRTYSQGNVRACQIDYRHVIHSLIRKPQAFRYSRLRQDILPGDAYQEIWQYADNTLPPREACKFIVGLLYLAATEDCEQALAEGVLAAIKAAKPLSLTQWQARFMTQASRPEAPRVVQHNLACYNVLLKELNHA
jgi:hypothetical protein